MPLHDPPFHHLLLFSLNPSLPSTLPPANSVYSASLSSSPFVPVLTIHSPHHILFLPSHHCLKLLPCLFYSPSVCKGYFRPLTSHAARRLHAASTGFTLLIANFEARCSLQTRWIQANHPAYAPTW